MAGEALPGVDDVIDLPGAGVRGGRARLRAAPEDFRVEEVLTVAPQGEGEHLWVEVEKRGRDTAWVAGWLARQAGVRRAAVGFAGRKDRHAIASQWFSLHLPGREAPTAEMLETEGVRVCRAVRHPRKLRVGALSGNRFRLILRAVEGGRAPVEAALRRVAREGVPAYFGPQRFGRGAGNLAQADALFAGTIEPRRNERGLYLSAARSWLFNRVLARRVVARRWNVALSGDAMMLAGSHSRFVIDDPDAAIRARVEALDIHPTGPLWGRGDRVVRGEAAGLEREVLAPWRAWCDGLERFGLEAERRALRTVVAELDWHWLDGDDLQLSFRLAAGQYATAVVRELVDAGV